MKPIKPIKEIPLHYAEASKNDNDEKLISAEQGKLWSTYMGNSIK